MGVLYALIPCRGDLGARPFGASLEQAGPKP
jgi:hypothetical protein